MKTHRLIGLGVLPELGWTRVAHQLIAKSAMMPWDSYVNTLSNRTDHPLSSPLHAPSSCRGLLHSRVANHTKWHPSMIIGISLPLPPFPMGGASPSVPPFNLVCCMCGFAVISESSRYMSPYPQSTPRGATSRCGGRLSANDTKGATVSYKVIPASIPAEDNLYSQSKARLPCDDVHNVQPGRPSL